MKPITLKLTEIKADPLNPRQEFDPKEMRRLEASIKRDGILQPLVVEESKGGYLLLDGERRFRTAKTLGLKEVPVLVQPPMSDVDRMVMRFNLQEQHTQWSAWEKSLAIQSFRDATGLDRKEAADMLGISPTQMEKYALIATLSRRTATKMMDRKLPFDYTVEMGRISKSLKNNEELREKLEDVLFHKIDNKQIMASKELRKYRQAILLAGEKVVERIIKDPDYTPSRAARESGANLREAIAYSQSGLGSLMHYGKIVLANKHVSLSKSFHIRLQELAGVIKELIDLDYDERKIKKDE